MADRTEDQAFDSISASIGELRAESRRHADFAQSILTELHRVGERLDMMSQLGVELREYRKTLHDRFDRINEIAAGHTMDIDKLEDRVSATENVKLITMDKRIDLLDARWKSLYKVAAVVGSLTITVGGWLLGTYGKALVASLLGG